MRRDIIRPAKKLTRPNQERIDKLYKLLEYHERAMHKWKKKLTRAFNEFDSAFRNVNRIQKTLEAEYGQPL